MPKKNYNLLFLLLIPILAVAQDPAYTPIQLVNHSGIEDKQVFFIAKAVLPDSGQDCFLAFDDQGIGECIPVSSATLPSLYSYRFDQVKDQILQIPYLNSGRLYVSVGYPMALYTTVDAEGKTKIVSPDGFNPRDPSFYTLHDKIEFSYAELNGFFINPTAVDFFTLPLEIYNSQATGELKSAGLSESHTEIFTRIHEVLSEFDKTTSQAWQKLFVYFGDTDTVLRFMAPGKAMVEKYFASFDIHYLDNKPAYGFDYITFVWDHYKNNTLLIDQFTGQVSQDNIFIFKDAKGGVVAQLEKPENSIPFFAGAGGAFEHENNTPEATLVREMTAAFSVGLLPAPQGEVLSKTYFEANKQYYYTDNPILGAQSAGPWYDLYGKALHSFNKPIYTFAYDDALGQDGTLHVDKGVSTPTQIILGDMSRVTIPNPYTQTHYQTVTLDIPSTITVKYQDETLKPGINTLADITTPLLVNINGDVVEIYIEYPLVVMEPYSLSAYGIVILPEEAKIIFPGAWE